MPFSKLRNKPKSIEVLEQIIAAIEAGEFEVGERLPPERELATTIGVSRTSIREALAALSMAGVIGRQPGSGTFVTVADTTALRQALNAIEPDENPHEIFEWQQITEPQIALLAAEKASKEELAEMQKALDVMRSAVDSEDRPIYYESDRRFHMAIAGACRNSIIVQEIGRLHDLMNRQGWRGMKNFSVDFEWKPDYFEKSLTFHEQLFDAILHRQTTRIKELFQGHYIRVQQVIFEGDQEA